jgi:hypothetical protein
VSGTEKVLGALKSVILIHERFDGLDERIKRLDGDLTNLSRSHSELAQRVARIEGVMEGYARASPTSRTPRLPKR